MARLQTHCKQVAAQTFKPWLPHLQTHQTTLSLNLERTRNPHWEGFAWPVFPTGFNFGLLFTAGSAPGVPSGTAGGQKGGMVGSGGQGRKEGAAVPGTRPPPPTPGPGAAWTLGSLRLAGLVPEPSGEMAQAGEGGRADPSSGPALPRAALGHPPAQSLPGRQSLPATPPRTRLGLDSRRRRRRRSLPEPTSASRLGQPAAQRGAAGPEHVPRSRRVPAPGLHQPCVWQVTRSLGGVCVPVPCTRGPESGRRLEAGRGNAHLLSFGLTSEV